MAELLLGVFVALLLLAHAHVGAGEVVRDRFGDGGAVGACEGDVLAHLFRREGGDFGVVGRFGGV